MPVGGLLEGVGGVQQGRLLEVVGDELQPLLDQLVVNLSLALDRLLEMGWLKAEQMDGVARQLLHKNAQEVYGVT